MTTNQVDTALADYYKLKREIRQQLQSAEVSHTSIRHITRR